MEGPGLEPAFCLCTFNKRSKGPHIVHLSTMCNLFDGQHGRPFLFTDRSKNTNLVEDLEILLSVKFSWIQFSGFRGEVKKVSARSGRPSCFSDRPQNTHLVEDIEILHPIKYLWIRFSGFRGEVENGLANQSHLVFPIGPNNENLVEDVLFFSDLAARKTQNC